MNRLHARVNKLTSSNYKSTLFVLLVVTISWLGALDNYAEDYITRSITESGIIYGVSRAINATISVAQTAQVDLVFISITVGEFLDPINDLVERFSEIMTIAITSLALQKLLLLVAKDSIFNILITVSGVLFLLSIVFQYKQSLAIKTFTTLALVRGSLLIILLANSTIDALFLESHISEGEQSIKALETEVTEIAKKAQMGETQDVKESIKKLDDEIKTAMSLKDKLVIRNTELEHDITSIETEIEKIRDDFSSWEWIKGGGKVDLAKNRIAALEEKKDGLEGDRKELETAVDLIDDELASKQERLDCAKKRLKGEKCSIWEIPDVIPNDLGKTTDTLKEKISDILNLMALVILRAILLPLLFWFLIYKTAKWIWREDFVPNDV